MTMSKKMLFLLPMFLSACASTSSTAKQALSACMNFQSDLAEEFWRWDKLHQEAIVADAKVPLEAETNLRAYRAKRLPVEKAFMNTRAVTVLGSSLIPLLDMGIKQEIDIQNWMIALYQASKEVRQALLDLGVGEAP
jgi:hypothetical protein